MNYVVALSLFVFSGASLLAADAAVAPAISDDPRLAPYQGRPRVHAIRMDPEDRISLDGRLDEAVWQRAEPTSTFTQQDPHNGEPPTEQTEVRFVYNADNLYMGVYCYDSEPTKLMGNQMLRDGFLSADDRFMWVFDPYLNTRNGYMFEVNPSGAMGDNLLGSSNGRAWDGIWTAKVRKFEKGWIIEVEIPFRTLNFDPSAPAWGVNFQRTVRRKQEEQLWSGWQRNQSLQSLRFAGLLTGINEASQGKGLDFRPYFVNKVIEQPGLGKPLDNQPKVGIDMYYSLTPQLRANLTINTDFAETEVDQRQVNLSQFPLFFPERRTFFLEGSGFFDFGGWGGNQDVMPFFSRRIGLGAGQPQRIEFGAKLTGQAGAYDVGLLQMRTAEAPGQPGEDFSVFRGRRRFFTESYFGGIYTRRSTRNLATPLADRHTAGADLYLATSRFRGNKNLRLSAFYLWTTHDTRPNEGGAHWGFRVDYPNDRWNSHIALREVQAAHNPAIGFVSRAGIRRAEFNFFFNPRPRNNKLIRRFSFGTGNNMDLGIGDNNRMYSGNFNFQLFGIEFQSGDQFNFRITPRYEWLFTPFFVSSGITLPAGSEYVFNRWQIQGGTANRRKVSLSGQINDGGFYSGTRRHINLTLGLRPMAGLLVELHNDWNRLELKEGAFSTAIPAMNVLKQFGPWISFSNNVQYDNVSRILGWQSRFRWIVKPGNDLYVVYQHNWISSDTGIRTTYDRSFATKINYTKRF